MGFFLRNGGSTILVKLVSTILVKLVSILVKL
jgi:hypothetical protein